MQDLHHADPTTVEYFHKTVACSRYGDGLQGELTEVDQMGGLCRQIRVGRSYCSPPHFQHAGKFKDTLATKIFGDLGNKCFCFVCSSIKPLNTSVFEFTLSIESNLKRN